MQSTIPRSPLHLPAIGALDGDATTPPQGGAVSVAQRPRSALLALSREVTAERDRLPPATSTELLGRQAEEGYG